MWTLQVAVGQLQDPSLDHYFGGSGCAGYRPADVYLASIDGYWSWLCGWQRDCSPKVVKPDPPGEPVLPAAARLVSGHAWDRRATAGRGR